MSKRGKDKKKKRRTKSFASSSGGETTLLVGIQGRNVPVATCTLPAGDSSSHTTRRTAPQIEDGLPELGSELPNLDGGSSHQAETDEKDWALLADDFMEDGRDSLLESSGLPSAVDSSVALADGPADPDRIAEPTMNQKAVPASSANIQHEEDRDENDCEVDYSSEESQDIIKPVAEIQNVIEHVAEIQNIIKPVAELESINKPVTESPSIIKPVEEIEKAVKPVPEFQSNLRPTAAEFQVVLAEVKPDSTSPPSGSTIQSSRVTSVLASPQPISSGSKDKAEISDTRQGRSIEQRATVLNRRVLTSADIMRLVKAKDIKVTRRHDHNLQQRGLAEDGLFELTDELDGYLSAGVQSVSVHHTVIE
jgi:hypothetical protein